MSTSEPRYAYEDPADLAWGAALLREGRRRRLARLAREEAERADAESRGGADAA